MRSCTDACASGRLFDGFTCGGTCVGPTSCPDGETLVDCFESSVDSVRECVVCGEGNTLNLVACGCTGRDCSGCAGPTSCPEGRVLVDCDESSVPGQRQCIPCPPDSEDENCGGTCKGPTVCPLGYRLVDCPGGEGERRCEICGVGNYGRLNMRACASCRHTRGNCNRQGFAYIECPTGSESDVSACVECVAPNMYVNHDRTGCFDACPSGDYAEGNDTQCSPCPACPDGQYATSRCNPGTPADCSECSCATCSSCRSWMVEVQACGARHDTVCANACEGPTSCPDGQLLLDCGESSVSGRRQCVPCPAGSAAPSCTALCWGPTSCPPGTVLQECWESSIPFMRQCVPCPEFSYETLGICLPCVLGSAEDCVSSNLYAAQGGCPAGSWSDTSECTRCGRLGLITNIAHTECVEDCGVGTFTLYGYDQCMPCELCPPDHFFSSACTHINEVAECLPCTECTGNESVLQPCTNVSDTICGACTGPTSCPAGEILLDCGESSVVGERECMPCPEGQFERSGACVDCRVVASDCVRLGHAFISCGVGESRDVSGCVDCGSRGLWATIDRDACSQVCAPGGYFVPGSWQCEPCVSCPFGYYQSEGCTYERARECMPCTRCPSDTVVLRPCSRYADAVCQVEGAECSGPTSCPSGQALLDCGESEFEGVRQCITCVPGSTAPECAGVCSGPVRCAQGEVLLDCGESEVDGLRQCVPCPEDSTDPSCLYRCSGPTLCNNREVVGDCEVCPVCMIGIEEASQHTGQSVIESRSEEEGGGGGAPATPAAPAAAGVGVVIVLGAAAAYTWYCKRTGKRFWKSSGKDEQVSDGEAMGTIVW